MSTIWFTRQVPFVLRENVILSTLCSLPKPHFWTASKWTCKILHSLTFLMLWKTFKSSANKTQLDLQTESQTAIVYTTHSNAFVIMPWGTLEFKVRIINARNWTWLLQVRKLTVKHINIINRKGTRKTIECRR